MSVEVTVKYLGDPEKEEQFKQKIPTLFESVEGHWEVKVLGDQRNTIWELTVNGPTHHLINRKNFDGPGQHSNQAILDEIRSVIKSEKLYAEEKQGKK